MSATQEPAHPTRLEIIRGVRTAAIVAALASAGRISAHDASKPEVEYHPTGVSELHAIHDQVRQGATPEPATKVDAVETPPKRSGIDSARRRSPRTTTRSACCCRRNPTARR